MLSFYHFHRLNGFCCSHLISFIIMLVSHVIYNILHIQYNNNIVNFLRFEQKIITSCTKHGIHGRKTETNQTKAKFHCFCQVEQYVSLMEHWNFMYYYYICSLWFCTFLVLFFGSLVPFLSYSNFLFIIFGSMSNVR